MRLVLGLLLTAISVSAAPAARVLILSGHNNHDWRETTPYLQRILDAAGIFETRVLDEPSAMTQQILANYDVVVSNYCGPRWSRTAEDALEAFVRSGKGFVVVHAASYPFWTLEVLGEKMTRTGKREEPWGIYGAMVGARWRESEPKTGHGDRHVYEVKWAAAAHPVAQGLAPSFRVSDELYHNFALEPDIQVLASAFDNPARRGTGKSEPLIWTKSFGQGRVFHTALGHDAAAMTSPGFYQSFARGVEWAASNRVTIPPDFSLRTTRKDAAKVLLVAGGHDHEASFYSVFESQPDLSVNVDPHPVAFRGDLRKRYDVLVLYDMVQELSDIQKKNLQDFAESGKGIVILHHALASYQGWPWFWKDLMAGHYLLKAEGNMPPSTYLHDVWQKIEPVEKHPITSGIPETWMEDETYKGMWISPEAKVLLRTDESTSDGPVAWISPYSKSRVVTIQLGHGREAHEHPVYRRLVHRAILWAAARLE